MVLYVLHLTEGTGSSTGGVFTYFFWVLLQVGSMVLPCSPPHGGDRLQHCWCLHLLLLSASPGRIHGPPMFSTSRRGQAPALVVCSPTVLHLGPSQVGSMVLPCSPPLGGDRLQRRWCLHLLLLGASPGRIHGPPMFSTSWWGQTPAPVVSSPTSSGCFSR
jgi:hypothetical protein